MRFVPLSDVEGPAYRFVPLETPAAPPATPPAAGTMAGFETEPPEVTPVTPPAPADTGPILPPQASLASLGRRVAEPVEPLRSPEETVTPMTVRPAPEPTKPAEPAPYRSRAEALDDAVNMLEEGADRGQVIQGFKKLGIEWPEIVGHGQKRGSDLFRPRTTEPGQLSEPSGGMRKIEPTFLESTANTFKRADANLKDLSTSLLFSAGAISPDAAAQLIRRQARQRGAAAPSEAIQQGLEAIGGAETYGDAAEAMLKNPRATLSLLVDSILVTAPALAATALTGPARPVAAFAASGAMEYAAVMGDVLQDKGIDLTDASKVSAALQNPEIIAEMKDKGAKRGLIIGTFDAISMGMAGRFLRPANELIAAGKLSGAAAKKATVAAWSKELALQMGAGAGGEFAAQQATGENKPAEVLLEGIAEGVTAPVDVAAALRQARASTREAQIAEAIESGVAETDFTREGIRREGAAAAAGIRPTTIAELARTLPEPPSTEPAEPSVGEVAPPAGRAEPTIGEIAQAAEKAEPTISGEVPVTARAEPRLGPPEEGGAPSGVAEPFSVPQGFRYAVTQSPAYEGIEPLSIEDADFELEALQNRAQKGKLTPEQFAASEIGKRLDTSQIMAIHQGLRTDPVGTINALRSAVGEAPSTAPRPPSAGETVTPPSQTGAPEPTPPPAPAPKGVTPVTRPVAAIPGMPTGEEIEEPEVTPVTPAAKPPEEPVTPVTPTFTPTQAAARLPETPAVAPITKPKEFEPATVDLEADGMPTVEVPLTQLRLSEDVPQFKIGATAEGVVEPLGGKFERTGVAPIQVWRRLDGSLEVISGRHRFDLAKRSGETTIPAQIHDEAKGFDRLQASILDAELNIRDGQGKAKDYVNYFKESGITKQDADARGLLARATGKRSYTIATQGSDELIAAVRADQIGDEAAFYIALNAPSDARLQSVGIKAIQDGKSMNTATNMMQAVKALAGETDTTLDMFGFDDSAIREAEEMAKIASQKQREIQTRLSAISGAAKNPALAKAEGIDIRDPEAIKRRIEELKQRKAAWDNWSTSPDLVAEIRQARGVEPPAPTVVEEPPAGPSLFDQVEDKTDTPAEEAAQIEDKTVRDKLKRIADNLGVRVFETSDSPSSNAEGYVNIPPEDKLVEGAQSADHVFAHELGHAVMQKRGMSYNRMPLKEVEKWIPGFAKLKDISKAYRPEMWKNPDPRMRRHANKPDEIIADALGAFFLGQASRADIAPLIDGLKLNDFELGIKKFDRRAAEDKMLAELRAEQEAKDLLTAPTPEDIRAKEEAAARRAQEAAEAERKAKADEARGDFVLTGSERAADEAAARGQLELGEAAPEPKLSPANQEAKEKYLAASKDPREVAEFKFGRLVDAATRLNVTLNIWRINNQLTSLGTDKTPPKYSRLVTTVVPEEAAKEPENIRLARKELKESERDPGKELTPAQLKRRRELIAYEKAQGVTGVTAETVVNNETPPADLPADNRLVLMPCCAKKGAKAAPAMELYKGVFFQSFASNVKPGAQPNVIILSAKHGFIDPTKQIEPYDQVMTPTRAKEMLSNLGAELAKVTWPTSIQDVLIVGGKEYQQVMRAAVADLVNAGRIPSTASINVTSGGIGEQRQQLNNYLQSIPTEAPAAAEPGIGAAVMGERMMNAANRFRKATMNQFKLTQKQADAAMGKLIKEKILTLDPVTGQFELKDGRFWDREVMLRAAEAQQGVKLMNIPEKKKLPPGRSPELTEAAQQLQRGEITAQKFDELVNRYKPIPIYFAPLQPATSEQVYNALDSAKRDKIDPKIPAGYPVGLRLDIPAFNRAGVFVVSIHEKRTPSSPGKVIGYSSAASIKNVTFGLGNQREALKIAAGSAKDAIQTMEGNFVPITADQAYQMADDAILSGDWVQVGFDPTRHAYFFDRSSTMPVVAADEVIQIGNMILAKGVTYGRKEDFLYDVTGRPAAPEPSLMTREGELIVGREAVREYQIKEYAALRKKLAGVAKKVAEGEVDIDVQRNTTEMMQKSRELQAAIKSSKPRVDTPEAFLAKALQEYDKGNIDKDVLDVIQAAYNKQPELLDGLLLSVRKTEGEAAGSFDPMRRIIYLYKSTSGTYEPRTIRHELSHSLEQMMTPEQRVVVVQAWGKALARAIKQNPDELHQRYFDAILKFLDNPSQRTMNNAQMLLPSYEMYQFINPSEYWAVNAERLMASQLGTAWDRFKRAVQQLFEGLKKVLGFDNQYDVHRVFSKVMKGSKERITRETLVDIVMSSVGDGAQFVTLNNIEPAKNLKEKYSRPNTPQLNTAPIRTFITRQFQNGKEFFQDAVENPKEAIVGSGNAVMDGLIYLRNKNVWYGSGLEARDFDRYNGQLLTSERIATASVALDNAIRSGNIGVEVIFRGGIEYDTKSNNFVAVERDLGMRGVYEAEAALKKQLGDQLGTDTIQGYLEAKRSISIMNELYEREAALANATENLNMLQSMGADPDDIAVAKAARDEAAKDVESIKKAASSVNMSEDEMYEFAALEETYPELRDIMDNWTAINQNLLRFWRQVGLLSQGRYDTLSQIKDYVPWYRIMNDEEDIHSAVQSTTRAMTNIGREKLFKRGRPISVVDFRAKQGQRDFKIQPSSVVQVEVNGKKVNPDLISVTPEGDVRIDMDLNDNDLVVFKTNREIENIIDNMTRNVMRMTMNGIRQFAANRIVLEYASRNEKGKIMLFPSVDKEKGRFNWIVNGKKVVVEIQDPLVAASIYGMENLNLKMWAPLAAVANLTRRTITLSGVFQIKQVFKDAPTAALVTGVKNPFALIGGVYKGFLTSLTNTDPAVDILKAAGIGGFHSPARTPEAEIKRRLGIMNRNVFSAIIKGLDHIGDASDMAQRVATYKRVLAETGNETQALYQAANVINFLHHGSAGYAQAVVKVVPFMGAYANATDVLVRALLGGGLKGMSRRKALARLGITTTLLAGTTILYAMLAGADPDYDELDDQTKLRNIIIPGTKIILPMNTSAAFFFKAVPELIYNAVTRQGTDSEMDARRIRRALGEAARDMLLGPEPVPAGVKPLLEVAIDHDFFTGRSVIPEGLKDVAAAEQYTARTSELGKQISAMLQIPGTDKRVLSPIEADHIVRGVFGTAGAMAQWFTNSIGAMAEARPEPTLREQPVVGSFIREEIPRGREDLFYDFKKEVFQKYKTYQKMIEREDFDAAEAYLDKHGDVAGMYTYINQTESDLKEINAEIRRLGETRSKDMTPKERRQEIDELQQIKFEILEPVRELRREAFK